MRFLLINKDWNKEQLEKSEFINSIKTLENMGFQSVSFRLFKGFNIDNGQELTPEESAKLPLYQIFQLCIDPVVDNIHPEIKNLLGFVPMMSRFSHWFSKKTCTPSSTSLEKQQCFQNLTYYSP